MRTSKGAPLRALLVVITIWVSVRIIWEAAFPPAALLPIAMAEPAPAPADEISDSAQRAPVVLQNRPASLTTVHQSNERRNQSGFFTRVIASPIKNDERPPLLANMTEQAKPPAMKGPAITAAKPPSTVFHMQQEAAASPSSSALSGYFWAFARQGSGSGTAPAPQSPGGQYGGSQAGAILTYRLAGTSRPGLSVFARASTALADAGQEELAIGISARPFARTPVSLFAEQRVGTGRLRSRGTAIYAAGGTGPDLLFSQTSLETYGQAGFVLSDNSSYFFDASASLQRKLWEQGEYKLTAGGGIWAGGQEGLTRLDVGPRANIHVPLGTTDIRFSLDWRQRIGGNAVPDSGAALTVTTGF